MPETYYIAKGRKRLANWAEWSSRDSVATDYPKATPYARLAKACAGWDSAEEHFAAVQSEMPVDDLDAERVEALVMLMPRWQHHLVCEIYLRDCVVVVLAARLMISRAELDIRLTTAEEAIGRGALTTQQFRAHATGRGWYA